MYAAKNWEKGQRCRCKGGQTCLQSKLLAAVWLGSMRHARRDHRVLEKYVGIKKIELAVADVPTSSAIEEILCEKSASIVLARRR